MNEKRRSPQKGYLFDEKQKYREQVWENFAKNLNVSTAVVVFLPSKEGAEIPLALSKGFKEENLIAIDDNPALIASSKWRKEYPKIRFYGNDLIRASERITKDKIKIDAVNLDLCGTISNKTFNQVNGFIKNIQYDNLLMSITLMQGREEHAVNCLSEIILRDDTMLNGIPKRLAIIIRELSVMFNNKCSIIEHLTHDKYKSVSGRVYMVWGIFKFWNFNHVVRESTKILKNKIDDIKTLKLYCDDADSIRYTLPTAYRDGGKFERYFELSNSRDVFITEARHKKIYKNACMAHEKYVSEIRKLQKDINYTYSHILDFIGVGHNRVKHVTQELYKPALLSHCGFDNQSLYNLHKNLNWGPGRRGPQYNKMLFFR